ncbi:MAG: helix-turn-helix domain-containing protein [Lachnospiraceae bacterium]
MGLEKIAEYKKKLGITSEELSKRSGVPLGTLNKILSGDTKDPKLGTLKAISRVLGCTLDDFDDVSETKTFEPSYEDVESLIARNGKEFSTEQKMRLIKLLSEIDK